MARLLEVMQKKNDYKFLIFFDFDIFNLNFCPLKNLARFARNSAKKVREKFELSEFHTFFVL